MPEPKDQMPEKIDVRTYIAMVLLRWQMLVLVFFLALNAGAWYIHLAPKRFLTHCTLMIYRDPNLVVSGNTSPWSYFNAHTFILKSDEMRQRVMRRLSAENFKTGARALHVNTVQSRSLSSALEISVESGDPPYAEAFLTVLLEEHEKEWGAIQKQAMQKTTEDLSEELKSLEAKIRSAEDDIVDYMRLHDIPRQDAKSSLESRYLSSLMERRSMLSTELMLLEAEFPALKDAGAAVIGHVNQLTRDTGAVKPASEEIELTGRVGEDGQSVSVQMGGGDASGKGKSADLAEEQKGWYDLKIKLEQLRLKEKELVRDLEPTHPRYKAVLADIEQAEKQLALSARVEMGKLMDRHQALLTHLKAVESAEYKWKANSLLANTRRAELKRVADVLSRYQGNYSMLYGRLHEMRISEELKADHFRTVEPVTTDPTPVWPDPLKILMVALAVGLGGGFGLVLLAQTFDNKIHTIKDVEEYLGVPFLGGVPHWIRGGLEHSIRPIVTEEHSTGAVEAYRALRTSVLAALGRAGEKLVFFTSADSREGKTLTCLNLAILIAQMGKKTLLIDMDLRRGRLHRSLGLEREPGVTDAIRAGKSIQSYVQATRIENLSFIPAGSTVENTAELLQSADLPGLFIDVIDKYDYILVDTSPVLRVTDTVILTGNGVGIVLYIARVNRTPKPMLKYSLDMLRDAKILGLIMNSIEMHKISSLYYTYMYPNYAYYSNAYAYGYDYYYYGDKPSGKGARHKRPVMDRQRTRLADWLRRTFLPMD
jgi:capsular exopolysaccharide synthesis family protein